MLLFTKAGCASCDYIKKNFDLEQLGIEVRLLGERNADALADLAWYGLVEEAKRRLPILVRDDDSSLLGAEAVRDYLIQRAFGMNAA
jgi:hypothetical protein